MTPVTHQLRDLRPPPDSPLPTATTTTDALEPRPRTPLRCAACDNPITDQDAAISVQGAHDHHLVNPHGHAFHVGIFNNAPGSLLIGSPVAFYSWFPGLPWQLAVCSNCHAHLGWSFATPPEFFALILGRLRS